MYRLTYTSVLSLQLSATHFAAACRTDRDAWSKHCSTETHAFGTLDSSTALHALSEHRNSCRARPYDVAALANSSHNAPSVTTVRVSELVRTSQRIVEQRATRACERCEERAQLELGQDTFPTSSSKRKTVTLLLGLSRSSRGSVRAGIL